uniref:Uncharacterized protein n=1 Tax=Podoviridae sp. ctnCN2 TaxID=2825274 RepID=A0A8S5PLE8_9CAUD|nr:MAG TPA: hypothetical protein [Podoviridae sp. ctnCN2]
MCGVRDSFREHRPTDRCDVLETQITNLGEELMNTWEDDERLYRSAFDPHEQTVREIESLREEVATLTREISALKKELASAKRENDTSKKEKTEQQRKSAVDYAKLIELVIDSDNKGSFNYFASVYVAIYKHHNKGYKIPSAVLDELCQYQDTFLWESIRKGVYSDDIEEQCREALRSIRTKGIEKVLLDRWMRIVNFLPGVRMRERYYYADITADDGYYETQ